MTIRVRLLETVVEIRTTHDEAAELLSLVWSAMSTEEDVEPARVYEVAPSADGGWIATAGEDVEAVHDTLWGVVDALRYRMLELFEERVEGYVTLHAAAVARGDELVLLAGESGAGKTTLTLALLEAGWAYLSDDVAPVEVSTGLIHPFPKPLGLKDPAVWETVSGAFGAETAFGRPGGSFLVPPSRWEVATAPLPPRALVFPAYRAGRPLEIEPLSAGKAAALASAYVRRLDPRTVALLNTLCSASICCRVEYGSSASAIHAVEDLLNHREPARVRPRDS